MKNLKLEIKKKVLKFLDQEYMNLKDKNGKTKDLKIEKIKSVLAIDLKELELIISHKEELQIIELI